MIRSVREAGEPDSPGTLVLHSQVIRIPNKGAVGNIEVSPN